MEHVNLGGKVLGVKESQDRAWEMDRMKTDYACALVSVLVL